MIDTMFGAILLTILPTLLMAIILKRLKLPITNLYLRMCLSWFGGVYLTTFFSYILALFLSNFTTNVLFKSTVFILLGIALALFVLRRELIYGYQQFKLFFFSRKFFNGADFFLIFGSLLFSLAFFLPQLTMHHGAIYRSPIFWDFHWLGSLIQTFAFGDNFPAQNETFSGLPINYHFYWMVVTAMYEVIGLSFVDAINFVSIFSFFMMLMTIIGISKELFHSRLVGIIAIMLTLTSSSFHFLDYFLTLQNFTVLEVLYRILASVQSPWYASFVNKSNFLYNGTFFNLFYFLEERQMIFGIVFLLLSSWFIFIRAKLSNTLLVILGFLMGAYFLWHLYITLMVLSALLFLLLFQGDRKKTVWLLLGFMLSFLPHYFYFKQLSHSHWFTSEILQYPKINFGFSDQEGKAFSFTHAYLWYQYAYGFKLLLFPICLGYLWMKQRRLAVLIAAFVLPTFLLLNTLQLSPPSVYENHKFIRPVNVIIDLALGYFIYQLCFYKRKRLSLTAISGIVLLYFLTISGVIELIPFLNSRPIEFVAHYPSAIINSIRYSSPKKSTFVGSSTNEILLAGRKLYYYKNVRGHDKVLDLSKRRNIIETLYETDDLKQFCKLTNQENIDYVEFNSVEDKQSPLLHKIKTLKNFSANNDAKQLVYFVDTKKTCSNVIPTKEGI